MIPDDNTTRINELHRLREIADAFAERRMFDERDVVLAAADQIEAMAWAKP